MAQSRLSILLEAKNNASRQVNRVESDLDDLDNSGRRAASGMQTLGRAIAVLGLADLARRAIAAAPAISEMAARIRFTRQAAEELAGSTEELNRLLSTYQRVTGGVATEGEALIEVSRLQAIGFANTTKELENFLSAARASSFATGRMLPEVISELQLAIANQSTQRFDQLGISVDSVRGRIDELQASTDGMSREAAFQQAVLDELNQKYGGLLESGAAAVTGMQDLQQSVRQASEEMGQNLGPNIDSVAAKLANLVDWLSQGNSGNEEYEQSLLRAAMASSDSTEQAREYAAQLDALTGAQQRVAMQTGEFEQQAWAAAQATEAAGDAAAAAEPKIINMGLAAQVAAEQFDVAMSRQRDYTRALQQDASKLVDSLGPQGALKWSEQQSEELGNQVRLWQDLGHNADEINNVLLPAYLSKIDDGVRKLTETETATRKVASATKEVDREFQNVVSKVESVLQGALNLDVGVNTEDFLPREDAINENARRLADIMVNGIAGQDWLGEFKREVPDIFETLTNSGDPQTAAAKMLREFEAGLRPELIDKEAAKERVRQMLMGDQNLAELAQEIAGELAAEMPQFSGRNISGLVNQVLGVKGNDVASGLAAGEAYAQGAVGAVSEEAPGTAMVRTLNNQLSSESNLSLIRTSGSEAGNVWGVGFLRTVEDGVPAQLIAILATLITPAVQEGLNIQDQLTGAAE